MHQTCLAHRATINFIHKCDFGTCLQKIETVWIFITCARLCDIGWRCSARALVAVFHYWIFRSICILTMEGWISPSTYLGWPFRRQVVARVDRKRLNTCRSPRRTTLLAILRPLFFEHVSLAQIFRNSKRYHTSLVGEGIGGKEDWESIYGCEHASRTKDQLASE